MFLEEHNGGLGLFSVGVIIFVVFVVVGGGNGGGDSGVAVLMTEATQIFTKN